MRWEVPGLLSLITESRVKRRKKERKSGIANREREIRNNRDTERFRERETQRNLVFGCVFTLDMTKIRSHIRQASLIQVLEKTTLTGW